MKVLIATDFSECSLTARNEVLTRIWPEDTEFSIISVAEPIHVTYAISGPYAQPLIDAHLEHVKTCRMKIREEAAEIRKAFPKNVVSDAMLEGNPAGTIIDKAKDWNADLIVLGSHGLKGIERFLLGSVAERVVGHAPCSVWIVKAKTMPKQ